MSWGGAFIDQIRRKHGSLTLLYRLVFIQSQYGAGDYLEITAGSKHLQIKDSNIRIGGTRVTNQSWSSTFGQFSIEITGDINYLLNYVEKGQIAILYAGFKGDSTSSYERLIWGSLENIRFINYQTYELVFSDALTSFDTRNTVKYSRTITSPVHGQAQHESAVFYTIGQTANLTANFNVNTHTNLYLDDVTIFEKDSLGYSYGLIKIDDPHNTDGPFFAEWTSKTVTTSPAGYLTLRNAAPLQTAYPTLSSVSISVSELHAADCIVTNCAQIEEFPPHIIGKFIQTNTGGALDSLPSSWGFSDSGDLNSDFYDYADSELQKAYIRSSNHPTDFYKWRLAFDTPVTEFMRLISDRASALGQWPVLRQGAISWRGVTDPYSFLSPNTNKNPVYSITDNDIIDVVSHDLYDTNVNAVYSETEIVYDQDGNLASSQPNDPVTLPVYDGTARTSDGLSYSDTYTRENLAFGDIRRMDTYNKLIPERISLRLPLYMSQFVAGDNVTLTSSILYGRACDIGKTYSGQTGLIVGNDIDLSNCTCILTILMLPRSKNIYTRQ